MSDYITLSHGSGGVLTHRLIDDIFQRYLSNDILLQRDDAARLQMPGCRIAFTTDSFVISPVFFKGGDIGRLAVCGTVNDLAAGGAKPLYLSCGFIIEEGFMISDLERVVSSMAGTAEECGVKIVTGDTKVVQKGACDRLFINTSGIGAIREGIDVSGSNARPGDCIIVTGNIGDHGCSILVEREMLDMTSGLESDCAPLNGLMDAVFKVTRDIHALRDPTRGGIASALNEIAIQSDVGIRIYEEKLPVKNEVKGICELLGIDPLYMANEGRMLIIAPRAAAEVLLDEVKKHRYGLNSRIIGEVTDVPNKRVLLKTLTGGSRIVDMPLGELLPRIC